MKGQICLAKKIRLATLPVAIAVLLSATARAQNLQQTILKAESRITSAWTAHDDKTVEALVSDQFVGFTVRGRRVAKKDILKAVRENTEGSTDVADQQVAIFGETAIYTALITDHAVTSEGKESKVRTRVTDVWVAHEEEVKLVASQETELPD